MTGEEYTEKVMDYLEYLGYPDMVSEFNPQQVAYSIGKSIGHCYSKGTSYHFCALLIFGLTWELQIVRTAKASTVN